jgi:hypothetical protein
MSDLRSEIVSKVLNSWEPTPAQVQEQSITRKIFSFISDNPSCTINDVVDGTGIELGRASATTLALYQRGKLDRKLYPNPDPNGKRTNVFVYWTTVDKYSDITTRRVPKNKPKKVKVSPLELLKHKALEKVASGEIKIEKAFNPEMFVQDLSLKDARAVYELLKGYFSG